jgi:hypothetical protein
MSYAWEKLRVAVRELTGADSQRQRLINAYTTSLVDLKCKDVPAEIRDDFNKLRDNMSRYQGTDNRFVVRNIVYSIDDNEVVSMIDTILDMYDTVTRYQPLRYREFE